MYPLQSHSSRRATKMNTTNNNISLSTFASTSPGQSPGGLSAKFLVVSDVSTSRTSSPPTDSSTSSSTLAAGGPPSYKGTDHLDSTHPFVTPSPDVYANSSSASSSPSECDRSIVVGEHNATSIQLLARLAGAILDESTKKKRNQQQDEEVFANPKGNDQRLGIRMPAVAAKFSSSPVTTGTSNVAITNGDIGLDDGVEEEEGNHTTLASSATVPSNGTQKKVRPNSLWTENSADSGLNAMHCFMLKELLEVVYDPKPQGWKDGKATRKPGGKSTSFVKASSTDGNDQGDVDTETSGEFEGRTKRRRTLTAKACETMDSSSMEGILFAREDYGKEADAATQTNDAGGIIGIGGIGNEQECTKPKRKFMNKPTPKTINPDGKAVVLCSDATITNQICIRCKFCKQTKGTGIIRPPSLEEGHWYIKILRMENTHFLNKCPKAPRELLDKLQALKKERKRGLKRSWKANALKQGLVTIVNDVGEPLGVSFPE